VFVLPIRKHPLFEQYPHYNILGIADVLFEVDFENKIQSNSEFEKLNKFDNQDVSVLIQAITDLTSTENFDIATSRFGWRTQYLEMFQVTVISAEPKSGRHTEYTLYDADTNSRAVISAYKPY